MALLHLSTSALNHKRKREFDDEDEEEVVGVLLKLKGVSDMQRLTLIRELEEPTEENFVCHRLVVRAIYPSCKEPTTGLTREHNCCSQCGRLGHRRTRCSMDGGKIMIEAFKHALGFIMHGHLMSSEKLAVQSRLFLVAIRGMLKFGLEMPDVRETLAMLWFCYTVVFDYLLAPQGAHAERFKVLLASDVARDTRLLVNVQRKPRIRSTFACIEDLLESLSGESIPRNGMRAARSPQEGDTLLAVFPDSVLLEGLEVPLLEAIRRNSSETTKTRNREEAQRHRKTFRDALGAYFATPVAQANIQRWIVECREEDRWRAPFRAPHAFSCKDDLDKGRRGCDLLGHYSTSCRTRSRAFQICVAIGTLMDTDKKHRVSNPVARTTLVNVFVLTFRLAYEWWIAPEQVEEEIVIRNSRKVKERAQSLLLLMRLVNHTIFTMMGQTRHVALSPDGVPCIGSIPKSSVPDYAKPLIRKLHQGFYRGRDEIVRHLWGHVWNQDGASPEVVRRQIQVPGTISVTADDIVAARDQEVEQAAAEALEGWGDLGDMFDDDESDDLTELMSLFDEA